MAENQAAAPRRRLLLFGGLLFVAGLIAGLLLGMFGARHFFFLFRPSPHKMAIKRAARLQKDFGLSNKMRDKILAENQRLYTELSEDFAARHERMEKILATHVENIATLLPDDAARTRWREDFRNYFPPPPPPPPTLHKTSLPTRPPG